MHHPRILVLVLVFTALIFGVTLFTFFSSKPKVPITFVSSHPNLQIKKTNTDYVVKELTNMSFFQRNKTVYELQKEIGTPIKSLKIILTNEPQHYLQTVSTLNGKDFVKYSSAVTLDQKESLLTVYLHMDKYVVETLSEADIDKILSSLFWRKIYVLLGGNEVGAREAMKNYKIFIEVSKK